MAARSASRHNPVLARCYQGLKKRGKLSKVAVTAGMRKLLIQMNSELKKPAAKPVNGEPETSNKTHNHLAI